MRVISWVVSTCVAEVEVGLCELLQEKPILMTHGQTEQVMVLEDRPSQLGLHAL
jgi:hypothetical protein